MVQSKATTVRQYLAELPPERRAEIERVRGMVLDNLPDGFVETVNWGMLAYELPLERYSDTYNKQPLGLAGLAAQKDYFALYLMSVYQDPAKLKALQEGFRRAGKKLDMGKSCIRFKRADDLAFDALAEAIGGTSADEFIAAYERSRAAPRKTHRKKTKGGKKR